MRELCVCTVCISLLFECTQSRLEQERTGKRGGVFDDDDVVRVCVYIVVMKSYYIPIWYTGITQRYIITTTFLRIS